jgi:hypothetical protein
VTRATRVHHAHGRHAIVRPNQGIIASDPASGFAYAPLGPLMHYRAAPYNNYNEPYFGASQGYAPGEKEDFSTVLDEMIFRHPVGSREDRSGLLRVGFAAARPQLRQEGLGHVSQGPWPGPSLDRNK